MAGEAGRWASGLAEKYRTQVAATGAIDIAAILRDFAPETQNLGQATCAAMKDNKVIAEDKATSQFANAERAISPVIEEAAIGALAREPSILKAVGMTQWGSYPPFMFTDPPPAADAPVDPAANSLAEHIKPEFIAQEGGLRVPTPSDASYSDFQQWYSLDLQNKLAAEASASSEPVRRAIRDCLAELQDSN